MTFQYRVDQKITDVISNHPFTVSAEIVPPRNGKSQSQIMEQLDSLVSSDVEFLSVTKGAGGSLRGGSLPIAQTIKDHFTKPCIAHFTCRDLIPEEIESLLIDHHYFGIRNILALRGDPPMGEEGWEPREGGYSYAYQLMRQIKKLNEGEYLPRKGFIAEEAQKTDFCIGAAVYPEHPDLQERIEFSKLKFKEGAEYGISQMLFDPEAYEVFLEGLAKEDINVPILPGLRVLKSQKQAHIMSHRFGCKVPGWYLKQLPEDHSQGFSEEQVITPFLELVERLKQVGAPGVHLFVLFDTVLNCKVIEVLRGECSSDSSNYVRWSGN